MSQDHSSLSVEISHCEIGRDLEVNINDILESPPTIGDHDAILSPIEKIENEDVNLSHNDSNSTATNSSTNSQTQPVVPKRKVFTFDVKKVFAFTQPKEKPVEPTPTKSIPENKANEESTPKSDDKKPVSVKSEEKKQKSEEKAKKSEEKKPKPEPVKSSYILFGQVLLDQFLKEDANLAAQDILAEVLSTEQKEPDPRLFAIEDEGILSPPKEIKEVEKPKEPTNKGTPKKGKQYKTVPFKGMTLYKAEKDNKKPGLANAIFRSKLCRYVGFENGNMIVGEKVKEDFKIKSEVPLSKLFQLSIERENPKKLILLFNKQKIDNLFEIPFKKAYKFENMSALLSGLRDALEKFGAELKLTYSQDFKL